MHDSIYEKFLSRFTDQVRALKVGDGMQDGVTTGPLTNKRGIQNMEQIMSDVHTRGGKTAFGGKRIGNQGNFWEPTVVTDLAHDTKLMTEEPFGPVAPVIPFSTYDKAVTYANGLNPSAYSYPPVKGGFIKLRYRNSRPPMLHASQAHLPKSCAPVNASLHC